MAEALVDERTTFRPSDNRGDWLGYGIYFFENAPLRAHRWARTWACRGGEEPAVVEAEIDLTDCLDLLDIGAYEALRTRYPDLDTATTPNQTPLLVSNGYAPLPPSSQPIRNFMDRALIDFTVELLRELDDPMEIRSVRGAFLWGRAVFPESFVFNRSHVQIAVRDPKMISKPKLVTIP
ncbi:MAG TPA: hypothetical protein VF495_19180 [Phenylobacterium sp.]